MVLESVVEVDVRLFRKMEDGGPDGGDSRGRKGEGFGGERGEGGGSVFW